MRGPAVSLFRRCFKATNGPGVVHPRKQSAASLYGRYRYLLILVFALVGGFVVCDFIGLIGDPWSLDGSEAILERLSKLGVIPGNCEVLLYSFGAVTVGPKSEGISGPTRPEEVVRMARKRYQRGSLKAVEGRWRFMWREDVLSANGEIRRVLRKTWLGNVSEISQREARRLADRVVSPLNDVHYRPGFVISFAEFAELWKERVLPTRKPSTQTKALQHLRASLIPYFGTHEIASIGQMQVQALVAQLLKRMKRKSALNIVGTFGSIVATAKKWGYAVGAYHAEDLELPYVQEPVRRRHFSPEVVRLILGTAEGMWRVLFATAALSGLRPGELLALKRGDLNFAEMLIQVRRSNDRGKLITLKSRRSYRDVPMPEPLREILAEYLMREWRANDDDLLFTSTTGTPLRLSKVNDKRLHPLLEEIGVPVCGMHAFRHTTASVLLSMGVSPKVVQAQLGHEDAETTVNVYGHLVGNEHRVAVEKMARVLLPANGKKRARSVKKNGDLLPIVAGDSVKGVVCQ